MSSLVKYSLCSLAMASMCLFELYAQKEKSYIRDGNKDYKAGKYADAEKSYRSALDVNGNSMEGSFNLGDAAYKQENYDDAVNQFELMSKKVAGKEQLARSFHNLGNAYLQKKEYQKSVDAYKQALRNNPNDLDTKYNMAYAQKKLKQQQQQQQQQKDQDQDKDKDKKDEQKDKKDQEKNDQDKKNEEQQKEEQQKQDQQKQDERKQDENNEQQQPKPQQLSQEEARKILEALKNKEMNLQDKLQKEKLKATKVKTDKDW